MNEKKEKIRIIAVHGTFAGEDDSFDDIDTHGVEKFNSRNSNFATTLCTLLSKKYEPDWHKFLWSGANSEKSRREASSHLSLVISRDFEKYARTVVIGHSHGGNVALGILNYSSSYDFSKLKLITLGTPFTAKRNLSWKEKLKILSYLVLGAPVFALGCLSISFILMIPAGFVFDFIYRPSWTHGYYIAMIYVLFFLPIVIFKEKLDHLKISKLRGKKPLPEKMIHIFCHPEDEAVNSLSSKATLSVAIPLLPTLFRFSIIPTSVSIFMALIFFYFLTGSVSKLPVISAIIAGAVFSISIAICSFFIVSQAVKLFTFLFPKIVDNFKNKVASNFVWKIAKGDDDTDPIEILNAPRLNVNVLNIVSSEDPNLMGLYDEIKFKADQNLVANKSQLFSKMIKHKGDLFSLIKQNTDLSKCLIHCNYFTTSMANKISEIILSD